MLPRVFVVVFKRAVPRVSVQTSESDATARLTLRITGALI